VPCCFFWWENDAVFRAIFLHRKMNALGTCFAGPFFVTAIFRVGQLQAKDMYLLSMQQIGWLLRKAFFATL
jgi:hypothetical protein